LTKRVYVSLDSPGGEVVEALNIGTIIRKMNFDTIVRGGKTCASACGLIWLAGRERWVSEEAFIGFHAVYYGEGNVSSAGNALVGAYLRDLGLSLKTINYLTQPAPESMEWLSGKTLDSVGIKAQIYKAPKGGG
jgi:hypothetical protein